jgi:hypothetical protein
VLPYFLSIKLSLSGNYGNNNNGLGFEEVNLPNAVKLTIIHSGVESLIQRFVFEFPRNDKKVNDCLYWYKKSIELIRMIPAGSYQSFFKLEDGTRSIKNYLNKKSQTNCAFRVRLKAKPASADDSGFGEDSFSLDGVAVKNDKNIVSLAYTIRLHF